jgi:helix-turn-helix protein
VRSVNRVAFATFAPMRRGCSLAHRCGEPVRRGFLIDVEQPRTIGQRLGEIRHWCGKSLRVVAELAGISESYLSRLERGERQVDSRSCWRRLPRRWKSRPPS